MLLWKASGEFLKTNWYIIENLKHDCKQNRRLPNIEIFYNRQRKQEKLDYLSSAEFTQRYYANLLAA
ncbi:hypothetical protein BCL69_105226 [Nitrosomonas communis]|uniref:Uncharacterized protein n=1 Tax=Nitrosomonas communis TaxID=44574 RepID=A0A0F7KD54_9PROT|nr:hypothetical protein AAW31_00665 [Nitrosomonas communis]TYP81194.1 hypothetical protein BCL69_105226 [Nitrosomonas communis]